mgnify:CR=1 FL=1
MARRDQLFESHVAYPHAIASSRLSMIRLARSSRSTNERDDSAKRRTGLPATKPAMAGRTKPERLEKAPEGELFLFKLGEMK